MAHILLPDESVIRGMTLSSHQAPARVPEAVGVRPDSNRYFLVSKPGALPFGYVCTPPSSGAGSASGGARTRTTRLEAGQAAANLSNASSTSPGGWSRTNSSAFSARRCYRVSFAGNVGQAGSLSRTTVPRQGIEPCVCRLKAGGFAVEACGASSAVPEAGIEPASSAFKERLRYQHRTLRNPPPTSCRGWNRTSDVHLQRVASVPALNPRQCDPSFRSAAVAGIEPAVFPL